MPGAPGGGEVDRHIALAVEPARIPHVRVVIGRDVDVVVLGPSDAFQMNRHRRPHRAGRRRDADDAGFDREVRALRASCRPTGRDTRAGRRDPRESVSGTVEPAVRRRPSSSELVFLRREAVAADRGSRPACPTSARRPYPAGNPAPASWPRLNRPLGRADAQRRPRRCRSAAGTGCAGTAPHTPPACRAPRVTRNDESRPGQVRVRRLLVIEIALSHVTGLAP